jgi:arabinogalactan endo-1,4-beta-galactosidase
MPLAAAGADNETINDQVTRQKEVDAGGSGRYKAIVVSEKSLPNFTVYRPRNIQFAARREGPLPILIWCNGACSGSSIGYEHMLNEMASHGYVVVGIGAFEMTDDERDDGGSNEKMVVEAINWLVKQEKLATSDYYHAIDVKNIALSGHSCGGAQAIANCANSRVKTLLIMNAGMGGMSMGGASPSTLNSLHCPIIYMTGGPDDVAYENAKTDYGKVKKPVAWADLSNAGHGGTYWDKYGGQFGKLALKWMDWQLKGYRQNARIFLKPDLKGFSSNWSVKTRNFSASDKNYDEPFVDVETVTDTIFDRAAADSLFDFGADVSSLTLETRQSKVYYSRKGQKRTLMPILKEQGVNTVRLRVLVNPSPTDFNLNYSRSLASTAMNQGLNVMLDLHYCDWWGDYVKPKSWKKHGAETLVADVAKHTGSAVKSFNALGNLRWVQIGHEVDNGFLWDDGRQTDQFVRFINAAYDTVKAINPDVQTVIHVSESEDTQWLTDYFDTLQANGAKWDAIGLSVHVKTSALTPDSLIRKVAQNVSTLRERYGKPVLIVETGYYNDRALEANQWLCDFLQLLMEAGASGLYYWEPELADDYDLGAWNPLTRKPSIALDAFLGVRHTDRAEAAVYSVSADSHDGQTEYFTPDGIRISRPQRGLNIVRKHANGVLRTYKVFVRDSR